MKRAAFLFAAAVGLFAQSASATPNFTHDPPGSLVKGSGTGRVDMNVYAPDMLFPMKEGEAFANSQVWGHGGSNGPGSQCDKENFSYPWHDNYCETRDWDMPLCPSGNGHQGQDVRSFDCKDKVHPVVAVADGTITNVGSYSVYLTTADGTRFDYLHMANVAVKEGDHVTQGQQVGVVSNQFGGEQTTIHLHFNIRQNVAGVGSVYVPPYNSLINAYEYHIGLKTREVDAGPDTGPPAAPATAAPTAQSAPLPPDPAPPPAEDDGCNVGGTANGTSLGLLVGVAIVIAARRRRLRS